MLACSPLVLLLLLATADSTPPGGDAGPDAAPPRLALFDGQTLRGWHAENCTAAVEEGRLRITDGNGLLRADHPVGDFVLELDYRPLRKEKYDSGIYFRAPPPAAGQPFPARYQVNLKQNDEGNLIGNPQGRSQGLVKPGEWNHLRLTVAGTKGKLEINGQPAWEVDNLDPAPGLLAIQVEVPGGGEFEFKEIYLTELGFTSLFNGRDLAGWEETGGKGESCWEVVDGTLFCTGKPGSWLRSLKEYGDFELRLEYQVSRGGNSGVYVRVPADGNHHGKNSGVEIQVLDDYAEKHAKLKPYQYSGGVYDIAGATAKVGRPAGEWNSLAIHCQGDRYQITHNGVVIVIAASEEFPALKERRAAGFLGLQNHNTRVGFRNLRIRELAGGQTQVEAAAP